jgi:hypothetical protein
MNKVSKNLLVGAMTLTLGVGALAGIAPAFAATDVLDGAVIGTDGATRDDLNALTGAVADSELVQITTKEILSIAVGNTGHAATIDNKGVTTPLGSWGPLDMPGVMGGDPTRIVLPNVLTQSYSHQIVKSNNVDGYFMSLMMCNDTADTNYPTVVTGCRATNSLESSDTDIITSGMKIKMTDDNVATLGAASPTATDGGYWGYRFSATTSSTAAATAPTGNWQAVADFDDNDPYGDVLISTAAAGVAAVNLNYGVITNNNLPAGVYNNYVIYTAVAK